jgi:acyl-CoA reductase-like NAD-dependent aldehyde dehydrogenase
MNVMTHPVPVPDLAARFIAKPLQLLIGGSWVNAKSGRVFDVFDPSTGLPIAKAAEGDAAVAAARCGDCTQSGTPYPGRYRLGQHA